MSNDIYRGQLTKWNDDRGFGFIQPEHDTTSVFLHISALQPMSRRPTVGDIVTYTSTRDAQGKVRAVTASIAQASLHHQQSNRRRRSYDGIIVGTAIAFLIIAVTIGALIFSTSTPTTSPPLLTILTKPGCVIKGNISISNGNKNYHLPGMEDYDATVIDTRMGEHWFCTEAEAVEQGWKRAPK